VVDKFNFPRKTYRFLGSRREDWCEFHRAWGHNVERCLILAYQLLKLVKEGFLTRYLEDDQQEPEGEATTQELNHEVSILGDLNTIAGGFSGGGSSDSS